MRTRVALARAASESLARPRRGPVTRGARLAFLLQLLANALALEVGEVVDEQLALDVIHLVLHAHGQRSLVVALEHLAVAILSAHADLGGALHLVVNAGNGQAALLRHLDALARKDLRIDEH